MYQYKAILKKHNEVIAEGHSLEDIEKQVLHFRRQQKKNDHTRMNDQIEVFHTFRAEGKGKSKEKLIKVL